MGTFLSILLMGTAPASVCQAPNVLVLFDESASMAYPISKFQQAREAVDAVTAANQSDTRFGLMLFPIQYDANTDSGGYCVTADAPQVSFGLNNASPISGALAAIAAPDGGNDTPIYQTLAQAIANPDLQDPTRRSAVILVTDGMQDCYRKGDYNDVPDADANDNLYPTEVVANRADLVSQVDKLRALGVPVFVVGFGQGVDPLTLNAMAVAAGTQRSADCNLEETDGAATDNCYFPATDAKSLETALTLAVHSVKQETCNGLDDDCDGVIDNGPKLCPKGQTCTDGSCIPKGSSSGDGSSAGSTSGASAGSSSGSDGGTTSGMSAGSSSGASAGSDSGSSAGGNAGGNAGATSGASSGATAGGSSSGDQTLSTLPPAANASNEQYLGSGLARGCGACGSPAWLGLAIAALALRPRRRR